MASSDLLPSDLKRAGLLKQPVSGCIVSVRERTFGPREGSAQNGAPPPKGKGKSKKNAKGPQIVKEFHLNGGSSPASVVLVEIWNPEVCTRAGPMLQVGQAVRLTHCNVVNHTKDSPKFTTSRLNVFLRATADTEITQIDCQPDWLPYHPVTSVADLKCLPQQRPVCVAGRLVEPAPAIKSVNVNGEELQVANATLRNGNELIRIALWRDQASLVNELVLHDIYMFSSFTKHVKHDVDGFELRAWGTSSITACPPSLRDEISDATPDSCEGGRMWSTVPIARKDYAAEEADWWTLSVCEIVCAPKIARSVDVICKVASVFI